MPLDGRRVVARLESQADPETGVYTLKRWKVGRSPSRTGVVGRRRCAQFPPIFPGSFHRNGPCRQNETYTLAKDLAARGDVFGIVNNVGVARHETIDAVDFEVFTTVMD